jgi:hypothetical protein
LGHRDTAPVIEDARQNIRAAAGAAGAVDQSIAKPADDCAVKCVEKNISLQVINQLGCWAGRGKQGRLQDQVSEQRVRGDRKRGPQDELVPTQKTPAKAEERNIPQKDQDSDRPACEVIDQLRNTADPTRCQVGRHKEDSQTERLDDRADQDQPIITDVRPVLLHAELMCKV